MDAFVLSGPCVVASACRVIPVACSATTNNSNNDMKTTLIAALVITNVISLLLLKQEREWSNMLMHTEGVEELVCGDEHMVVLKVENEWSKIDTEWAQEQAEIEAYEQYDPWDEDESIQDQSAND